MKETPRYTDDTIDSRSVIARIEQLKAERDAEVTAYTEENVADDLRAAWRELNPDDADELDALLAEYEAAQAGKAPRLCIRLEGGVVQSVFADAPVDVLVIDYDTEGSDGEDLFPMPQEDGSIEPCFLNESGADVLPKEVERIYKAIADHEAAEDAAMEEAPE